MSSSAGLANEYGRAYFMLTEELGISDGSREDVLVLEGVLAREEGYLPMLDTPALTLDERLALIDGALAGLDGYLINLVKLLAERRCAYLLPRTLEVFLSLYDESRGIVRVEATTAIAMTEGQTEALRVRLEEKTGKKIIISNTIDKTLLGGVRLRYMGIQLDGTLRTRLDGLARGLKGAVV